MKTKIFIIASLLTLCFFNWSIYAKEEIRRGGELVYLQLAPVDPRSLIQGDYMRLNYRLANDARLPFDQPSHGNLVISVDADHVGHFERIDNGAPLKDGEKRLPFTHDYNTRVTPDSFLFQEGQAGFYSQAKYGVFRFNGPDSKVLVGLADERKQLIEPPPAADVPTPLTRNGNSLHITR